MDVGENTTENVQVEPAASVEPQLSVTENGALMESPIPVSGSWPLLVNVTVIGDEDELIDVLGKLSFPNESVAVGAVNPVPLSVAVIVPLAATTVSVPFSVPATVGLKATTIAQDVLAATLLPQELLTTLK
jgi:hypothetical protein